MYICLVPIYYAFLRMTVLSGFLSPHFIALLKDFDFETLCNYNRLFQHFYGSGCSWSLGSLGFVAKKLHFCPQTAQKKIPKPLSFFSKHLRFDELVFIDWFLSTMVCWKTVECRFMRKFGSQFFFSEIYFSFKSTLWEVPKMSLIFNFIQQRCTTLTDLRHC